MSGENASKPGPEVDSLLTRIFLGAGWSIAVIWSRGIDNDWIWRRFGTAPIRHPGNRPGFVGMFLVRKDAKRMEKFERSTEAAIDGDTSEKFTRERLASAWRGRHSRDLSTAPQSPVAVGLPRLRLI